LTASLSTGGWISQSHVDRHSQFSAENQEVRAVSRRLVNSSVVGGDNVCQALQPVLLVHLDGFRQQQIHSRMPTLDTCITLRCIESGPQLFYAHQPAEFVTQFVLKLLSIVRQEFPKTAQRDDHSLHKPPGDSGSFLVANRPCHDELCEAAHHSANIRQSIDGSVRPIEIQLDSVHGGAYTDVLKQPLPPLAY